MLQKFRQEITQYLRENLILVIYSIIGTTIVAQLFLSETRGSSNQYQQSLIYAFILGLSLCLSAEYLYEESPRLKKLHPFFLLGFFSIGFTIAHYLKNWDTFQIHILAVTYFLFLLTPTAVRKDKKVGFHWLINVLYAIGLSISIALVLYGLLAILGLVTQELFNIKIPRELSQIGSSIIFVFLPINLFGYFKPKPKNVSTLRYSLPETSEKPIRLIFLPVLLIYIAVLLLYTLKILIDLKLPKGMVSIPITIAYTLFFTLDAYWESQEKETEGIWKYRNWIQASFFPLFIVMGIGVITRISEYGFTQDRVYLLITYIFMLVTVAVRLIYKSLELRKLMAFAAGTLLITSAGPLSPPILSYQSQINRFLQTIAKYKDQYSDLKDFNISEWKAEDVTAASSSLNIIFSNGAAEALKEKGIKRNLFSHHDLDIKTLKENLNDADNSSKSYREGKPTEKQCLGLKTNPPGIPENSYVRGFDWIYRIDSTSEAGVVRVNLPSKEILEVDLNDAVLRIQSGDSPTKKNVILDFKQTLADELKTLGASRPKDPFILKAVSPKYKIELRIYAISICDYKSIDAIMLLKEP